MRAARKPWLSWWVLAMAMAAVSLAVPGPGATAASGDVHAAMVKDVRPGMVGSVPHNVTAVGSRVFYNHISPDYGDELWVSDGTRAGTHIVKDIFPGWEGSEPRNLTAVGDRLFFSALAKDSQPGFPNRELFVSDGTRLGTQMVRNINNYFRAIERSSDPEELTDVNGTLYFSAIDTNLDRELWKSDGTKAGTVRVRNLNAPTPGSAEQSSNPANLTAVGDTLFFNAIATGGNDLWKSDGTFAGTVRVKGRLNLQPTDLTALGTRVFFTAGPESSYGRELWVSDGTATGTHLVKDILRGPDSSQVADMTAVGDKLFFAAHDANLDNELWTSDGTKAGTQRLKNINPVVDPANPSSQGSDPTRFADLNGTAYFSAITDSRRFMWKSDGTKAGTVKLPSTRDDGAGPDPVELTVVGDAVFFRSQTSATGDALFYVRGSVATQVTDESISADNEPTELTEAGGALFFRDYTRAYGEELWRATIEP